MVVDSAQGQHQVALLEMEKLRAELEARNGVLEWKAEEDKRYKDYLREQIGFNRFRIFFSATICVSSLHDHIRAH
jgi:hypothetical protein